MELHLPPKPTPTVLPGEFRFAAAGLAHGHIYGMVNGLLDAGAELVGVESMNQSVELILTGRADVTLNAETAFYDFMKSQPDQPVKIAGMTDSTTSSVIPVRKGNESLVSAINAALDEIRESGELAELSVKYFGQDITEQ